MSLLNVMAVLSLPLLGSLLFLCRNLLRLSNNVIAKMNMIAHTVALIFAGMIAFFSFYTQEIFRFKIPWFEIADKSVELGFLIRPTTACLLFIVAFISAVVNIYAWGYMKNKIDQMENGRLASFFSLLGLFTSFMQGFVVSSNLLQLYICWEALGVTSFLLIGFWQREYKSFLSARKAFIMTRIGDMGIFISLIIIWCQFGTWEIDILKDEMLLLEPTMLFIVQAIAILIAISALVKAGQMPLHTWLPDAMVGPTPVSALLHAATMVVAGVYLLDNFYFLFSLDELHVDLILLVCSFTALYAAVKACFQKDIKRFLAYSTMSHVGFMFSALALNITSTAFVLLVVHATFKALLFLLAGFFIHQSEDSKKPFLVSKGLYIFWFLGLFCLIDVLSLKKNIFTAAFNNDQFFSFIFLITAYAFTFCYAIRLWTFVRWPKEPRNVKIFFPKGFQGLGIALSAIGALIIQIVLLIDASPWFKWLGDSMDVQNKPVIPFNMTLIGFAAWVGGAGLAILFAAYFRRDFNWKIINISWFDKIYKIIIISPLAFIAEALKAFNQIFVNGLLLVITNTMLFIGYKISQLGKGQIQHYLLWSIMMFAVSTFFLLWMGR